MLKSFKHPLTLSAFLLLALIPLYLFLFFTSPLANKPDMKNPKTIKISINNKDSYPYAIFKENNYDDVVSIIGSINYEKQGGLAASWGIPNRRNIPQVSLFDNGQCTSKVGEQESPSPTAMRLGNTIPLKNLTNNCWYTHYGALSNWLWYGLYKIGARAIVYQKLFAVALNIFALGLVYFSIRRFFTFPQTLFSIALLGVSPFYIDWIKALNYNSWQNLFLALFIFIIIKPLKANFKNACLAFLIVLQSLNSPEYLPLMLSLFLVYIFSSEHTTKEKVLLPIAMGGLSLCAVAFHQFLAFKNSGLPLNEFWQDFTKILFRRKTEFWAIHFYVKNYLATLEHLVAPYPILLCSCLLMMLTKFRWKFLFVLICSNLSLILFTATALNHSWIFYKFLFIPAYFSIIYLLFKPHQYTKRTLSQVMLSMIGLTATLFLLNNSLGDLNTYFQRYSNSKKHNNPHDKVLYATESNIWSIKPSFDYSHRMTAAIDQGNTEQIRFFANTQSAIDIFWGENQASTNKIVIRTNRPEIWKTHSHCELFYLKEGVAFFSAPIEEIETTEKKVTFLTKITNPFLGLRLSCQPNMPLELTGVEVY